MFIHMLEITYNVINLVLKIQNKEKKCCDMPAIPGYHCDVSDNCPTFIISSGLNFCVK